MEMLHELAERAERYIAARERVSNYTEARIMREMVCSAHQSGDWRKVRDRMDPRTNPDIIASAKGGNR